MVVLDYASSREIIHYAGDGSVERYLTHGVNPWGFKSEVNKYRTNNVLHFVCLLLFGYSGLGIFIHHRQLTSLLVLLLFQLFYGLVIDPHKSFPISVGVEVIG